MSRTSSQVLSIKCDVTGCDKEQIHVQVGQTVLTDADWGQINVDGDRDYDLCPDHANQFEDFLHGVLVRGESDPDPVFYEDEDAIMKDECL